MQPKYIGSLLKAAEERKRNMERRIEKSVQKEREAEKGLFDDKEAFVTDAYRQKMEQIRQEEERERRQEELEGISVLFSGVLAWIFVSAKSECSEVAPEVKFSLLSVVCVSVHIIVTQYAVALVWRHNSNDIVTSPAHCVLSVTLPACCEIAMVTAIRL